VASTDDFFSKRIVYAIPGMERTEVRSNIVYKHVDGGDLKLDVYVPPGLRPTEMRPAVVFVHGDGPSEIIRTAKDWGQYVSWGQLVAAAGLVGITFNHRSTERRTSLPQAAADVEDLLSRVRTSHAELSVDPERICIWTCSMGPPIALPGVLIDTPSFVRGIVCYYGALDLVPLRGETPPEVADETLDAYSPVRLLERSTGPLPPMLLARAGREERPWLNPSIDRFAAVAVARGAEIDLLVHPRGRHAFDVLDDDSRSREIIARTLDFMGSRLTTGGDLGRREGVPFPRAQDLFRHLEDLRSRRFEGAEPRGERMTLFRRAVELLDPVVRAAMEQANHAFLDGSGEIEHRTVEAGEGDAEARWELSWPEQRRATNVRAGGSVGPVQVVAWFAANFTHPHVRGSHAGNWPLQVLDEGDARRQEPIIEAIVEAELHERIFEGTWKVIPSFVRGGNDGRVGDGVEPVPEGSG
jgi:acetyl esterase/lipase